MNRTSMTVATGLFVAFASAVQAQVGGYPLTFTLGWTSSYSVCYVGATIFTLPGSETYLLPTTAPGYVDVGMCWDGSPLTAPSVPTGWLGIGNGYAPPPPSSYIGNGSAESAANDENSNEEPLTPNPHLVNSTDTQDPPGGGGGTGDVVHETALVIPPTTTTPEPASFVLVGSGLAGLAGLAWRRRKP